MEAAIQSKPFTPFQIEMLEMASRVSSEAEMHDIRRMLGQYFAKRPTEGKPIDWDSMPELPKEFMELRGMGNITDEDIASDERLAYIMRK